MLELFLVGFGVGLFFGAMGVMLILKYKGKQPMMFGRKRCPVCGGKFEEFTDEYRKEFRRCKKCGIRILKTAIEQKIQGR